MKPPSISSFPPRRLSASVVSPVPGGNLGNADEDDYSPICPYFGNTARFVPDDGSENEGTIFVEAEYHGA